MNIKFKENLKELLEDKHMTVEEMMKELNIPSLENLTVNELNKISEFTEVSRSALVENYFRTAMFKTEDDLIKYVNEDRLDLIKELYRNDYLFNRRNLVSLISFKEMLKVDPIIADRRKISLKTFNELAKYLLNKGEIKMLIDLSSDDYCLAPYQGFDMDDYITYMVDSYNPRKVIYRQTFGSNLYDLLTIEDQLKFEERYVELLKQNVDFILSNQFDGHKIILHDRYLTIRDKDDGSSIMIFYKDAIYNKFSPTNHDIVEQIYQDILDSCGPITD